MRTMVHSLLGRAGSSLNQAWLLAGSTLQTLICGTAEQSVESPKANLCGPCSSIFVDESFFEGATKPHHPCRQSIEDALAMGCELCRRISWLSENVYQVQRTDCLLRKGSRKDLHFADYTIAISSPRQDCKRFNLYEFKSTEPSYALARRSLSNSYTGHPDALDLAKYWFEDCVRNHGLSCLDRSHYSWYPTRLLDISTELVKLFAPEGSSMSGRYATVSYCWGNEPFFKATPANIVQLQAGVPQEQFPQVFQDLMKAARHLHIRYLWIDCYCIIQSVQDASPSQSEVLSDWEREAGNMEKVYENSVLNFGVTHATSPLQSCFCIPASRPWRAITMEWKPRECDKKSIYQITPQTTETLNMNSLYDKPLFSRGWVLQERLLCPRMLHFTEDQIYWECSARDETRRTARSLKSESCPTGAEILLKWDLGIDTLGQSASD